MNLVKSLKDGSFDKAVTDNTSFISPEKWHTHFESLLSPPPAVAPDTACTSPAAAERGPVRGAPDTGTAPAAAPAGPGAAPPDFSSQQLPVIDSLTEDKMAEYIRTNCDKFKSSLDFSFTRSEVIEGVSSLDNHKAASFDRISNEMLKAGKLVLVGPMLVLFNAILSSTLYPSQWKPDILTPLHKSNEKNDPNNYRGISVASCFGKLFLKLMQKRLESLCTKKSFIHESQGSGKAGSRTSDHLIIVKFLIDKYVKKMGKQLFACFVDLRKAYDTVPRTKLFYTLLKDYSIGGNYLKILQEMYRGNQVFIKLTDRLLQHINTTI